MTPKSIFILIAASCVLTCSIYTISNRAKNGKSSITEKYEDHQRALARAYFRLGVSASARLMREHDLKGEPTPPPAEFLKECIQFDITMSGTNESLLKDP